MGQPYENEFTVNVVLDDNGEPIGLAYYDREGCGHESAPMLFEADGEQLGLRDLFNYHEDHRRMSHNQRPRKGRCREVFSGWRCSLKQDHDKASAPAEEFSKKHRFEW